jgi:gliding motility-associated-like protein
LFTDLNTGSYTVHIQDSNGCINTLSVDIPNEPGILLTSLTTTPTDCGEASGGVAFEFIDETLPVQLWINTVPMQIGPEINSLASGEYLLSLIDAAGCRADTAFTITRTGCPVYIPNVFSPNGDGANDFFRIYGADEEHATISRFYVFDRWGNNVYARFNFDIHEETGWWDGMFKRFVMDPGVFAYYIEVEFEDGERAVYKGDVTLIR